MIAETQSAIDEQNPWPGLDAFDESAERFFNGRESEAATLRRLVLTAPLTILFGGSGLGKTSLIQAGLFPLLRKEHYFPLRVRLDCRDRVAPLIDQVKVAFQSQIDGWSIDAPSLNIEETIWQYLHRTGLEFWSLQNQLLTPVFVLDQFEEVFTVGADNGAAIGRLLVDLADLVENRIPLELANSMKGNEAVSAGLSLDSQRYRVLLSFREDFLPAVEGWKRLMPSILRNRLRLLPMSGEQAFRAVHDTAPHLVDEVIAWRIVRFVAAAQDDGLAKLPRLPELAEDLSIEPALLSLVCNGLNEKRKAQQKRIFDDALLTGTGQSIVADFYERQTRDLSESMQRFIENELITNRGFRKPCDLDDARSVHGVTDDDLRLLENRRLLRMESQHRTERVELIHDLLTSVVREHREQRRKKEEALKQRQEQAKRRKRLLTAVGIVALAILSLLGSLTAIFALKAQRAAERAQQAEVKSAKKTKEENDHFNKLATAASYLREGEQRRYSGKYQDSLTSFKNAAEAYKEENDRRGQVSALISGGDVLASMGRFDDAENAYTQARVILKAGSEQGLQAKILESLASLNERRGRITDALKYYADANRLYQMAGDSQAGGRVLERLAFEAENSRSLGPAAALYKDALKNYKDSGDELGTLRVQQALTRILGYWGFLVDLRSGQTYQLRADTVNVGRNVEGVNNDISFSNQLVSRRHVAINRDMHIDDLRSRNGTTLNARLLPYGIGAKLSDKDIIVLANVEPLQFRIIKPSTLPSSLSSAWALFINSGSKDYRYMTSPEYFLSIEDGKLSLQLGSSTSGVLKIRRGQDKAQMLVTGGDWQLVTTVKETDYEYKSYIMNKDVWIDLYDLPLSFVKLTPDGKTILVEGPAFQIVLFDSSAYGK